MNSKKNLKNLLIEENGEYKNIDLENIDKVDKGKGLLWIDLDSKSQTNRDWLHNKSNLDKDILEALLAEDTRPRYFHHNNGFLIILRAVNLNKSADIDDMVSLRMWVEPNRIISIWRRKVFALDDIKSIIILNNGPTTEGEFIAKLTKLISVKMGDVINSISDQIDDIEDKVFDEKETLEKTLLSELRRQIIKLRRYIAPQKEVIGKIQEDKQAFFSEKDCISLRETKDKLTRFIEELDANKERSAVIRDELESQLNHKMNKTMYLLSLVTVVFLPLGLITGLLGINVTGIPFAQNPFAFIFVCVLLIVIAVVEIVFFRNKKWM